MNRPPKVEEFLRMIGEFDPTMHLSMVELNAAREYIARLEEENARLLEERDNWRVSSACREKQAMIDHLAAQIKKLEEHKQRIEEGEE